MKNQNKLRTSKLDRLRGDIREGIESGLARRWDIDEMKRQGRKLLAARRSASR